MSVAGLGVNSDTKGKPAAFLRGVAGLSYMLDAMNCRVRFRLVHFLDGSFHSVELFDELAESWLGRLFELRHFGRHGESFRGATFLRRLSLALVGECQKFRLTRQ